MTGQKTTNLKKVKLRQNTSSVDIFSLLNQLQTDIFSLVFVAQREGKRRYQKFACLITRRGMLERNQTLFLRFTVYSSLHTTYQQYHSSPKVYDGACMLTALLLLKYKGPFWRAMTVSGTPTGDGSRGFCFLFAIQQRYKVFGKQHCHGISNSIHAYTAALATVPPVGAEPKEPEFLCILTTTNSLFAFKGRNKFPANPPVDQNLHCDVANLIIQGTTSSI